MLHSPELALPDHIPLQPENDLSRLAAGDVVADGRYGVVAHLRSNHGLHSQVYRAIDRRDGGAVALKLIGAVYPHEQERAALELEAHWLFNDQPGFIPTRDMGVLRTGGGIKAPLAYLVTEFASEGSVEEVVGRNNEAVGEILADMVSTVAPALDTMHQYGLVHRDSTGTNILATIRDGQRQWWLTDFGLIQPVGQAQPPMIIPEGLRALRQREFCTIPEVGVLGTIAPEYFTGGAVVGPKADTYTLAATCVGLATGQFPALPQGRRFASYMRPTNEGPVSEPVLRDRLGAHFAHALIEALSLDPDDRSDVTALGKGALAG